MVFHFEKSYATCIINFANLGYIVSWRSWKTCFLVTECWCMILQEKWWLTKKKRKWKTITWWNEAGVTSKKTSLFHSGEILFAMLLGWPLSVMVESYLHSFWFKSRITILFWQNVINISLKKQKTGVKKNYHEDLTIFLRKIPSKSRLTHIWTPASCNGYVCCHFNTRRSSVCDCFTIISSFLWLPFTALLNKV